MCGDGMGPMGPGPNSGGPGGPPNGVGGDTMDVMKTSPGHDPGTPREDSAVLGDFNMVPYGNGENVYFQSFFHSTKYLTEYIPFV